MLPKLKKAYILTKTSLSHLLGVSTMAHVSPLLFKAENGTRSRWIHALWEPLQLLHNETHMETHVSTHQQRLALDFCTPRFLPIAQAKELCSNSLPNKTFLYNSLLRGLVGCFFQPTWPNFNAQHSANHANQSLSWLYYVLNMQSRSISSVSWSLASIAASGSGAWQNSAGHPIVPLRIVS